LVIGTKLFQVDRRTGGQTWRC